ncbi:copper amine oxidase N-terminal domain-containing protein [Desulfovirgula thermocuniculi]|uniref:copper amine oxidase N-terminal domain-containing protein n=1 Tax=Desulfovirgula thermocuniculi TaxID=348842 RepID=UPI0004222E8A|nr:copper amine oxidase N-terminal domain-containing protein [Desulfovirgula thermocuniculi]
MKKVLFLVFIVIMAGLAAKAAAGSPVKVVVNGEPLSFDVTPRIESGRLMVSLRAVAEALGAVVEWDEASGTATVTGGSASFVLNLYRHRALAGPVAPDDYAALGAVTALRRHIAEQHWTDPCTWNPAKVLIKYEVMYLTNDSLAIAPPPLRDFRGAQRGAYHITVRLYFADFSGSAVRAGTLLYEEKVAHKERVLSRRGPTPSGFWYEDWEFTVAPKGEPLLREHRENGSYRAELEQGGFGWEVVASRGPLKTQELKRPPVLVDPVTAGSPPTP